MLLDDFSTVEWDSGKGPLGLYRWRKVMPFPQLWAAFLIEDSFCRDRSLDSLKLRFVVIRFPEALIRTNVGWVFVGESSMVLKSGERKFHCHMSYTNLCPRSHSFSRTHIFGTLIFSCKTSRELRTVGAKSREGQYANDREVQICNVFVNPYVGLCHWIFSIQLQKRSIRQKNHMQLFFVPDS